MNILSQISSFIKGLIFLGKIVDSRDTEGLMSLRISGRNGEILENVLNMQQYGMTSRPADGTKGIALQIGGDSGMTIFVATESPDDLLRGLAKGEAAIYNRDNDFVWIKNGGVVHAKAASKVYVETPLVEMTGDVLVRGNLHVVGEITSESNISDFGSTVAAIRNSYNNHAGHYNTESPASPQV